MLCIKCKKRQAVVYIQRQEGSETKSEGYCLTCAQELNIKPVNDMLKRFGISPEDLEGMEEKMNEYMEENGGMPGFPFGMMGPGGEENGEGEEDGDSDGEEEFTPGGSPTFPFGMNAQGGKEEKDPPKDKKGPKGKGPKYKFLDTYCENLTAKARGGKLDNIIGRDKEIYRTIQILCRRQKNNPCLIGEAGVGKTAIAEGIAQRIAKNEVPQRLQGKEIYLLDMTALVAGTQFRGQFEQRVKGLINEVKKAGNIILFIDEVHSITGAGESEGAMNAANILKPALSRGEIQVIG
ncbi:MAG: ATP-dependent Clp protease ATP-binding subunit, partial [Oscillospiraceae bacterium]|nr:ATP-dependent Clp protease ATP-binding subunit [Oscillospiraceae bacterium]